MPPSTIKAAASLYENFTGKAPGKIIEVDAPHIKGKNITGLVFGLCDGFRFKDNKGKLYDFEYNEKNRPLICSRYDGENLYLVGGEPVNSKVLTNAKMVHILYTTVRDGVKEHYKHKFSLKARPSIRPKGKQITLIGSNFRFTDRGIIDR